MANYYGNRSAIVLECPHCHKQGDHHTRKTEQQLYTFRGFAENAVKFRCGDGEHDVGYRVRVKDCKHCGEEFRTVEFPEPCLSAILAALDEASVDAHKARQQLYLQNEAVTKIKEALQTLEPGQSDRDT